MVGISSGRGCASSVRREFIAVGSGPIRDYMGHRMDYLYHVEVAPGLGYECIAEEGLKLVIGDIVIVQCERYQDYASVTACHDEGPVPPAKLEQLTHETNKGRHVEGHRVPKVLRRSTEEDKQTAEENDMTSQSMAERANERIAAHKLDMKLVHTHYSFDRRLAVFQFAAEGRVDFRELLRDLSHTLRTRVELRQVGVRDEAALQGGIGVCGRAFCCSTFLKRFSSISVKMAKIQGLSLNPLNISGTCGRLKCCLQYEYSRYREDLAEEKRQRAQCPQGGCGGDCPGAGAKQEGSAPGDGASARDRDRRRRSGSSRSGESGRQSSRRADSRRGERPERGRPGQADGPAKKTPPAATPGAAPPANDKGAPKQDDGSPASGSSRRRRSRRRGRRGGNRQEGGNPSQGGKPPQGGGKPPQGTGGAA